MCPHTCKVGPQASFIMENIDADIPCIFFKTFRSPLQDILQRELHIFTRTWLIMLITIKPWLPSIHLNSPWYARWAICIVHVWSAIAYGIWVIQSYAETYLLGILYNCRQLPRILMEIRWGKVRPPEKFLPVVISSGDSAPLPLEFLVNCSLFSTY